MAHINLLIGKDSIQMYGEVLPEPLKLPFDQFHKYIDAITPDDSLGEGTLILRSKAPSKKLGNVHYLAQGKTITELQKKLPDFLAIGTLRITAPDGIKPQNLPENFNETVLNNTAKAPNQQSYFGKQVVTLIHPSGVDRVIDKGAYRTIVMKSETSGKNEFHTVADKRLLEKGFGLPPSPPAAPPAPPFG